MVEAAVECHGQAVASELSTPSENLRQRDRLCEQAEDARGDSQGARANDLHLGLELKAS